MTSSWILPFILKTVFAQFALHCSSSFMAHLKRNVASLIWQVSISSPFSVHKNAPASGRDECTGLSAGPRIPPRGPSGLFTRRPRVQVDTAYPNADAGSTTAIDSSTTELSRFLDFEETLRAIPAVSRRLTRLFPLFDSPPQTPESTLPRLFFKPDSPPAPVATPPLQKRR
ncbi:hypothetical protein B0H17DRAFT_1193738 [Mycena rosella]|uniref:Uncharacterized protein n=1 Tax=Mycena rosella TaxID=1033263 RepID=A0AAD7GSU0_MYCRO|nr:hypothetical protein B0H17DRAFT_1193738 [Mycena rosella]